MSSKPDKKHDERTDDKSTNIPGQQTGQTGQGQKKEDQYKQNNPRGGEESSGQR